MCRLSFQIDDNDNAALQPVVEALDEIVNGKQKFTDIENIVRDL